MKENKNLTDKRLEAQVAKQSIIDKIIEQTEKLTPKQLTEQRKDREAEIIELIGGDKISIKQIKGIIAEAAQNYSPIFPRLFYNEIYRLNKWPIPKEKIWQKSHRVAVWTNILIYSRLSMEVLHTLQQLNPYITLGVRANYHYQWLTPDGKHKVEGFIIEATMMMQTCNTWIEFRKKYAKEYKLPLQLQIWE